LLDVPLLRRHSFQCLHTAARATCAIGEALYSARENLIEILHQPRDCAHGVPQQSGVGREMDIGFHHGGVDAQPLAILQTELDGGLHHRLIDRLHSDWGEPIKRTIESIVFGYAVAMEVRKGAQGITVVDAFAQLAIIPVFDAHEDQRAQGLRRGNPVAAGVGVLQPAYQILAHLLDQRGMVIQESENALQPRVEVNALIP